MPSVIFLGRPLYKEYTSQDQISKTIHHLSKAISFCGCDQKLERIDLCWRRFFFVHKEFKVFDFFLVLQDFQFREESDRCAQRHTIDGLFFVAFTYQIQVCLCSSHEALLSKDKPNFPLYGIIGLSQRWWSFLGSINKSDS